MRQETAGNAEGRTRWMSPWLGHANLGPAGRLGMLVSRGVLVASGLALGLSMLGDAIDPATNYPAVFTMRSPGMQAQSRSLEGVLLAGGIKAKVVDPKAEERRKAVGGSVRTGMEGDAR